MGQNGAGKTTTMNILSGQAPSTEGDVLYLQNLSLRQSPRHLLRKTIGVCPQHDILFDDLTAAEHIWIYAGIKGISKSQRSALVEDRLKWVKLWEVRDRKSGTFSGG